jgi:CHASE3 domain sensor protein
MDSYDILVIGLSVLLAIYLTLSIFVVYKVSKLVKKIDLLTDSAQHAVENAQDITSKISSAISISTIGNMAAKVVQMFKKGDK